MKKSILLGMLLCGAAASFAQKNAPVYTERLDSVISTGEANFVKENYEYNEDGGCTVTKMLYSLYTRKIIAKQVVVYDNKGRQISVYTYNLDEENPNISYLNYEYSYDDKGRKIVEKEYFLEVEQVCVSKFDYSGVSGYPKVVVTRFIIGGEDTGMEYRKYYNADDKEVLEEQGVKYDSGEWKISHRYVTVYENNTKKSYTHYRSYDYGETFILDYQELYYANGKLKEHNDYYSDIIYNYKKYDKHGNIIEEYKHVENNGLLTHNYYKNTYDSEGRLIEKVRSQANADYASERSTYVYKTTKSGIAYYVETNQNYFDSKWNPYYTNYYVQSKVEDGKVTDYSSLYISYANTDLWPYSSYDVSCNFYSKKIKDKVSATVYYKFNGEEPACLLKYDSYKYSTWGDFTSYDLYRNPLLVEDKGDNLTFIGTNEYVYDEKILGSKIFLGSNTHYKLLYEVLRDTKGKEIGRTTYYYSPYKATTTGITSVAVSADNEQAIYNLSGQRVNATQKGQIYIQNGKKFMAK